MIKNIIFDFGNVIANFDEKYILSRFFESAEDSAKASPAIFEGWTLLDDGAVDYGEYTEAAVGKMPERLKAPTRAFFADWYRHLPYVDGIESLIGELKGDGYRLYLLSNAPVFLSERRDFYKVFKNFDGIIFSGDEKLSKPDLKIFELLLSRFSLYPEECLFIDDLERNIKAAESLGITGYLFDGDAKKLSEYIKKVV